jgi:stage II sporulation protein R
MGRDHIKEFLIMIRPLLMKHYIYIVFAIIMLITSWEYNISNAALAEAVIPEESIRLRILANSDSPRDQLIKRKIKDEIVKHMNEWVQNSGNIIEARKEVEGYLPAFEQLVGDVLQQNGFRYSYSVELDIVDFPTKMYGNQVYPAGDYEALRVKLGSGKGQNWWCVLFPPLCFVDLASGTAVTPEEQDVTNASVADKQLSADDTEIRFFLWDMLQSIGSFIKGLFA